MTAERAVSQVRWPIPPEAGFTVDDLFGRTDLPEHTELIDGSFVFMTPQRLFHSWIVDQLVGSLRATLPVELRAWREMAVLLSRSTVLEPDVLVVGVDRVHGNDQSSFHASDVVLAIEVSSPSSLERDRDTKPHKYARAGIPHFWRIERDGDQTVAYLHRLDDDSGEYVLTATQIGRLATDEPVSVDVDLTEIDRL